MDRKPIKTHDSNFPASIHPVAELTDDHGRMQLYLVGWVTWVLAMALLALVAWATAHWDAIE